jgi:hypothetical protein
MTKFKNFLYTTTVLTGMMAVVAGVMFLNVMTYVN